MVVDRDEVDTFRANKRENRHDRKKPRLFAMQFVSTLILIHLSVIPYPDHPFLVLIAALKEKEKGDWKKLSIEEKKQLYRASFCQTYAEMNAPTGEWKSILGCAIGFLSLSLWCFMGLKLFVYPKELPKSFELERRQAQLQRMIDMRVNPIDGLTSNWDYEKGDWKK